MKKRSQMWTKKRRQQERQEKAGWLRLRLRLEQRPIPKLRLKREPWLPMITQIQLNCAKSDEWIIAALELGVKCKADVDCVHKAPRD